MNWRCIGAAAVLMAAVVGAAVRAAEDAKRPVKVIGRVIDEDGNSLAGATVRVVVPAVDMLYEHPDSKHRAVETTTDDQGRYEVQASLDGNTSLAVGGTKPGFLVGTFQLGNDPRSEPVSPGQTIGASFVLHPGLHVAGVVLDEVGNPVAQAVVRAGPSEIEADKDGRFQVFSFPPEPEKGRRYSLEVTHSGFVRAEIGNIYTLSEHDRSSLRIALSSGRKISGRVVDAAGKPVADALVEARFGDDSSARRAAQSGPDGRFALTGLLSREAAVLAQALPIRQHLKKTLALDRDQLDLELRLAPIKLVAPADTVELLGMKLATITPEVRAAYFLDPDARGAIVLDPGKQVARLGLGKLREGDYFIGAGEAGRPVHKLIYSLRQFVDRLQALGDSPPYRVRVECVVDRMDRVGTEDPVLELTADDLRQIAQVAATLARLPAANSEHTPAFLGVATEAGVEEGRMGVRITRIEPDTPAAKAGLVRYDIISKVDNVAIHTHDELRKVIRAHQPGDKVIISTLRSSAGSPQNVTVTLE